MNNNDLKLALNPQYGFDTYDVENYNKQAKIIWDFSIELLKKAYQGENLLISPISALAALQTLYHGTAGTTREQIESVLHTDMEELETYLESVFGADEKGADEKTTIGFSNAICVTKRDDISVCESFKEKVRKSSFTEFFELPKEEIKNTLNAWSAKKTNGMIPEIIENVSDESILHVLNAISFEAEWERKLRNIEEGLFTDSQGKEETVTFMCGEENDFISDAYAIGFEKLYADKRYVFAALRPEEGMTLQEYIHTLSGRALSWCLKIPSGKKIDVKIPKFGQKCETNIKDFLNDLGIAKMFDGEQADFSRLCIGKNQNNKAYVDKIIQKARIQLDENGTKAYAVTYGMCKTIGLHQEEEPIEVYLDSPFLYIVYDRKENIPVFIGTIENFSGENINNIDGSLA